MEQLGVLFRGQSRSLEMVPFDGLHTFCLLPGYYCKFIHNLHGYLMPVCSVSEV